MKTATQTSADLAAMRRPAAGNPIWRRREELPGDQHRRRLSSLLLVVASAGACIAPEQLRFATEGNLAILSQQIPITAIAAIGVGILMISGEFDISIAGTFTLVPFVVAITFGDYRLAARLCACLAGLAVAIAIGASTASSPSGSASRPSSPRSGRCSCCAASSASSRSTPRPTSRTASPSFPARRSRRSSPATSSGRSTRRSSG